MTDKNLWFEEAACQLQLGALWKHYALLLDELVKQSVPDVATAADRLNREVLAPFLQSSMPGVQAVIKRMAKRWRDSDRHPVDYMRQFPLAFLRTFVDGDWKALREGSSAEDVEKALLYSLAAADKKWPPGAEFADVREVPDTPQEPVLEVVEPDTMVVCWIRQAKALAAWQRLRPEIKRSWDQMRPPETWKALQDQCKRLGASVATHRRATVCFRLFPDPCELQLLKKVQETLPQCQSAFTELLQGWPGGVDSLAASYGQIGPLRRLDSEIGNWIGHTNETWVPQSLVKMPRLIDVSIEDFFKELASEVEPSRSVRERIEPYRSHCGSLRQAGRLGVVHCVLAAFDRLDCSPDYWREVETWCKRFVDEDAFKLKLLYDVIDHHPDRNPEWKGCVNRQSDCKADNERFREVGLVLRKANEWTVVKQAIIVYPSKARALRHSLDALAEALRLRPKMRRLSTLRNEFVDVLRTQDSENLDAWWRDASPEEKGKLWQLIQRVMLLQVSLPEEARGAAIDFLRCLQDLGFEFPKRTDCGEEEMHYFPGGIWYATTEDLADSDRSPQKAADTGHDSKRIWGTIVRGPDGTQFGPAIWLLLQNHGAGGRLEDVSWWSTQLLSKDQEDRSLEPVYKRFMSAQQPTGESGDPADADPAACELLSIAFRRLRQVRENSLDAEPSDDHLVQLYTNLTCDLYCYLVKDRGCDIWPNLNQTTLEYRPIKAPFRQPTIAIEYEVTEQHESGVILNDPNFTLSDQPATWKVSVGRYDDKLKPWLNLPSPDFDAAGGGVRSLEDEYRKVRVHAIDQPQFHEALNKMGRTVRRWLIDDKCGREWFDRMMKLAAPVLRFGRVEDEKAKDAQSWYHALCAGQWEWFKCYPKPSRDNQPASWPREKTSNGWELASLKNLEWKSGEPGTGLQVLEPVRCYGAHSRRARCVLSLGPVEKDSPYEVADRIVREARQGRWPDDHPLRQAADALYSASLLTQLQLEILEAPRAEGLAKGMLDQICDLAIGYASHLDDKKSLAADDLPPEPAQVLNGVLKSLRNWCRNYGLHITPDCWSFGDPIYRDLLNLPKDTIKDAAQFTQHDAKIVLLRKFGLATDSEPSDAGCQVVISAGRAPEHYDQMRKLAESASQHGQDSLVKELDRWPAWWLQESGSQELAAHRLFRKYWDSRNRWIKYDPQAAENFADSLARMLENTFQMRIVHPTNDQIHDRNWVSIRNSRSQDERKILQVVHPALVLKDGHCQIPALVDVD